MTTVPKLIQELDLDGDATITLFGEHIDYPEAKPEIKKTILLSGYDCVEDFWSDIEPQILRFIEDGYLTDISLRLSLEEFLNDY